MVYRASLFLACPLSMSFILFFVTGATAAAPIPDTGQITSYTATVGEDSDYAINLPSYTKLGQNGVVLTDTASQDDGWIMTRDNITGLIWELKTDDDSIHDKDSKFSWCDTNPETNGGSAGTCGDGTDTEYLITTMNANAYGGFSDWRMPTRMEMRTVIDYDTYGSAVDTDYFPNIIGSYYWSSNTQSEGNGGAGLIMNFYSGEGNISSAKANSNYVLAVRDPNEESDVTLAAFVDNGDGTVTDTRTGLMWQKQHDESTHNWLSALGHCEGLLFAGYDDWRLPNIKELASIVDLARFNPAIDPIFINTLWQYWSSTSDAQTTVLARYMNFRSGSDNSSGKTVNPFRVRAVRGGQISLSGHLFISNPIQGGIWPVGETQTILWDTQSIPGNVTITLSRDGGITFPEILSSSTPNDGSFQWMVNGTISYNCVLKIIPLDDTSKTTAKGLFTIKAHLGDIDHDGVVDLSDLLLGMQVQAGISVTDGTIYADADVNGDDVIGMAEMIYILRKVSGLE